MADQPTDPQAELRELLGSEVYDRAFAAVMSGTNPGLLPDHQRTALVRARELANVDGGGYPAPLSIDPNRPEVRGG